MKCKRTRVSGCINGLDSEIPELPSSTCYTPCVWRVNSYENNNCSWSVFESLSISGKKLTLREIGVILGTTHETVRNIQTSAIRKIKDYVVEEGMLDDKDMSDISPEKRSIERASKYGDKMTRSLMIAMEDEVEDK